MDLKLILSLVAFGIIMIGLAYFFYYSMNKDLKRLDKEEDEIKEYLITVVNRISLTTSTDALFLLHNEMMSKIDSFNFTQKTHTKWTKVQYYLLGKAHGLRKRTDINITIN